MTATTEEANSERRPTILCIDDDPDLSEALKLRLVQYGIDVIARYRGIDGFWAVLDTRPDAIICDLVMPGGEGNYIVGRLKSHARTKDVPIIILTGHGNNPAIKRQMMMLGATAFLTKPLVFDELLDELRAVWPAQLSAALGH